MLMASSSTLIMLFFLFRSDKKPGYYGNFFIVVVILGQKSGERLKDHWFSGFCLFLSFQYSFFFLFVLQV